ncbi:hypothetical protein D3C84_696810 [compost metagenome]
MVAADDLVSLGLFMGFIFLLNVQVPIEGLYSACVKEISDRLVSPSGSIIGGPDRNKRSRPRRPITAERDPSGTYRKRLASSTVTNSAAHCVR